MHGTGHGVGHFLNVHEGPQSVSFRPNSYSGGLQIGMTMTDEPGYYEDGKFGIRYVSGVVSEVGAGCYICWLAAILPPLRDVQTAMLCPTCLILRRIENVCVVVKAAQDVKPRGTAATFEHITCAPITTRLVEVALLSNKELQWLNAYNAWVRETLKPVLLAQGNTAAAAYLDGETNALERPQGAGPAGDVYVPAAAEPRGAASFA